ncbi:4-oxalocrotonate decarboxylase [Mycobacteroides abscessus subsp. abscessus]|nr:4-oxalocrotonate decarboxylase [Mycobacteroides abscessus subsp. abscessus]
MFASVEIIDSRYRDFRFTLPEVIADNASAAYFVTGVAANVLAERGHAIEAGWIVMTGGMTDAVAAPRGSTLGAHFTHLGSVGLTC